MPNFPRYKIVVESSTLDSAERFKVLLEWMLARHADLVVSLFGQSAPAVRIEEDREL